METEKRWYVLHVAASSENQVMREVVKQFEKKNLGACLENVLVPSKEVDAVRKGSKVRVEERVFPGYVFVRMTSSPEALHLIRRVPRVLGFLGADAGGRPSPLSDEEMEKLMGQVERISDTVQDHGVFEIGQVVRVCDGIFVSMEGVVENLDLQKKRLKVSISILGRPTPVDLDFGQVEKIGG